MLTFHYLSLLDFHLGLIACYHVGQKKEDGESQITLISFCLLMNLHFLSFCFFFTVFLFLPSYCIQKSLHVWQLTIALIYIQTPFPCSCYSWGFPHDDKRELCPHTVFLLISLLPSLEFLGFWWFAMRQTKKSGNVNKHTSQYHMQQRAHLTVNAAPVSNESCRQLALWPQAASGPFTFTSLFALLLLWLFQLESAGLHYTKPVFHLHLILP